MSKTNGYGLVVDIPNISTNWIFICKKYLINLSFKAHLVFNHACFFGFGLSAADGPDTR